MDRNDGPRARGDFTCRVIGIETERFRIDVGKDWNGADGYHGGCRRDKRVGWHDDLVAGDHSQRPQTHFNGGRAIRARHAIRRALEVGESAFELPDFLAIPPLARSQYLE